MLPDVISFLTSGITPNFGELAYGSIRRQFKIHFKNRVLRHPRSSWKKESGFSIHPEQVSLLDRNAESKLTLETKIQQRIDE